jgi:putative ABC transport system permease protein
MITVTDFKFGFRNLVRNPRRTAINIVTSASGFAAIVIFSGFSDFISSTLATVAIDNQYGHIQIARKVVWDKSETDSPKDRLFDLSELSNTVSAGLTKNNLSTMYLGGRLPFFSLLTKGEHTVSARAEAFDPELDIKFQDPSIIVLGRGLNKSNAFEVVLGEGIFKQLRANLNDDLTILGQTTEGAMNALDVQIVGVSRTQISEIDDYTFYVPLKIAQKLLDTDHVEKLVVMLDNVKSYKKTNEALGGILPSEFGSKTWYELADLFRKTEDYFSVQNALIGAIFGILIWLSIMNTVGNSIMERTGEIGTMRAMGDTRSDVVKLFLGESFVLGIVSVITGWVLGLAFSQSITAGKILMPLPGATEPITVEIYFTLKAYLGATLLVFGSVVAATIFPAMQASRIPIVEALKAARS